MFGCLGVCLGISLCICVCVCLCRSVVFVCLGICLGISLCISVCVCLSTVLTTGDDMHSVVFVCLSCSAFCITLYVCALF